MKQHCKTIVIKCCEAATSENTLGLELPDCSSREVQGHPQLLLHFVGSQIHLWGNSHGAQTGPNLYCTKPILRAMMLKCVECWTMLNQWHGRANRH